MSYAARIYDEQIFRVEQIINIAIDNINRIGGPHFTPNSIDDAATYERLYIASKKILVSAILDILDVYSSYPNSSHVIDSLTEEFLSQTRSGSAESIVRDFLISPPPPDLRPFIPHVLHKFFYPRAHQRAYPPIYKLISFPFVTNLFTLRINPNSSDLSDLSNVWNSLSEKEFRSNAALAIQRSVKRFLHSVNDDIVYLISASIPMTIGNIPIPAQGIREEATVVLSNVAPTVVTRDFIEKIRRYPMSVGEASSIAERYDTTGMDGNGAIEFLQENVVSYTFGLKNGDEMLSNPTLKSVTYSDLAPFMGIFSDNHVIGGYAVPVEGITDIEGHPDGSEGGGGDLIGFRVTAPPEYNSSFFKNVYNDGHVTIYKETNEKAVEHYIATLERRIDKNKEQLRVKEEKMGRYRKWVWYEPFPSNYSYRYYETEAFTGKPILRDVEGNVLNYDYTDVYGNVKVFQDSAQMVITFPDYILTTVSADIPLSELPGGLVLHSGTPRTKIYQSERFFNMQKKLYLEMEKLRISLRTDIDDLDAFRTMTPEQKEEAYKGKLELFHFDRVVLASQAYATSTGKAVYITYYGNSDYYYGISSYGTFLVLPNTFTMYPIPVSMRSGLFGNFPFRHREFMEVSLPGSTSPLLLPPLPNMNVGGWYGVKPKVGELCSISCLTECIPLRNLYSLLEASPSYHYNRESQTDVVSVFKEEYAKLIPYLSRGRLPTSITEVDSYGIRRVIEVDPNAMDKRVTLAEVVDIVSDCYIKSIKLKSGENIYRPDIDDVYLIHERLLSLLEICAIVRYYSVKSDTNLNVDYVDRWYPPELKTNGVSASKSGLPIICVYMSHGHIFNVNSLYGGPHDLSFYKDVEGIDQVRLKKKPIDIYYHEEMDKLIRSDNVFPIGYEMTEDVLSVISKESNRNTKDRTNLIFQLARSQDDPAFKISMKSSCSSELVSTLTNSDYSIKLSDMTGEQLELLILMKDTKRQHRWFKAECYDAKECVLDVSSLPSNDSTTKELVSEGHYDLPYAVVYSVVWFDYYKDGKDIIIRSISYAMFSIDPRFSSRPCYYKTPVMRENKHPSVESSKFLFDDVLTTMVSELSREDKQANPKTGRGKNETPQLRWFIHDCYTVIADLEGYFQPNPLTGGDIDIRKNPKSTTCIYKRKEYWYTVHHLNTDSFFPSDVYSSKLSMLRKYRMKHDQTFPQTPEQFSSETWKETVFKILNHYKKSLLSLNDMYKAFPYKSTKNHPYRREYEIATYPCHHQLGYIRTVLGKSVEKTVSILDKNSLTAMNKHITEDEKLLEDCVPAEGIKTITGKSYIYGGYVNFPKEDDRLRLSPKINEVLSIPGLEFDESAKEFYSSYMKSLPSTSPKTTDEIFSSGEGFLVLCDNNGSYLHTQASYPIPAGNPEYLDFGTLIGVKDSPIIPITSDMYRSAVSTGYKCLLTDRDADFFMKCDITLHDTEGNLPAIRIKDPKGEDGNTIVTELGSTNTLVCHSRILQHILETHKVSVLFDCGKYYPGSTDKLKKFLSGIVDIRNQILVMKASDNPDEVCSASIYGPAAKAIANGTHGNLLVGPVTQTEHNYSTLKCKKGLRGCSTVLAFDKHSKLRGCLLECFRTFGGVIQGNSEWKQSKLYYYVPEQLLSSIKTSKESKNLFASFYVPEKLSEYGSKEKQDRPSPRFQSHTPLCDVCSSLDTLTPDNINERLNSENEKDCVEDLFLEMLSRLCSIFTVEMVKRRYDMISLCFSVSDKPTYSDLDEGGMSLSSDLILWARSWTRLALIYLDYSRQCMLFERRKPYSTQMGSAYVDPSPDVCFDLLVSGKDCWRNKKKSPKMFEINLELLSATCPDKIRYLLSDAVQALVDSSSHKITSVSSVTPDVIKIKRGNNTIAKSRNYIPQGGAILSRNVTDFLISCNILKSTCDVYSKDSLTDIYRKFYKLFYGDTDSALCPMDVFVEACIKNPERFDVIIGGMSPEVKEKDYIPLEIKFTDSNGKEKKFKWFPIVAMIIPAPKVYCLHCYGTSSKTGKPIIFTVKKAKGVDAELMSTKEYIGLINGYDYVQGSKSAPKTTLDDQSSKHFVTGETIPDEVLKRITAVVSRYRKLLKEKEKDVEVLKSIDSKIFVSNYSIKSKASKRNPDFEDEWNNINKYLSQIETSLSRIEAPSREDSMSFEDLVSMRFV